MNLTLSKRGDYVVRSALCLARAFPSGEFRKIREVVAEMGVPQTFASQILKDLVNARLAISRAGKDGGYRLSLAPKEINILAIVEAGEGPLRSDRCALGDGPCRWEAVCPLHTIWTQATQAMRKVLEQTTLADLMEKDLAIELGTAIIPSDSHRPITATLELHDSIQVEFPKTQIVSHFKHENWLVPLIKSAFTEADSIRSRTLSASPSWAIDSLDISISHSDPTMLSNSKGSNLVHNGDAAPNADEQFMIYWEAITTEGLSLHCDGLIDLSEVDFARSEITFVGRMRPPHPPTPGLESDIKSLQSLATTTIRTILRKIATVLETSSEEDRISKLSSPNPPIGSRKNN